MQSFVLALTAGGCEGCYSVIGPRDSLVMVRSRGPVTRDYLESLMRSVGCLGAATPYRSRHLSLYDSLVRFVEDPSTICRFGVVTHA